MKAKMLKRYLIKLGVIFFIIIAGAIAAYLFADNQNEALADDLVRVRGETATFNIKNKDLRQKLSDADEALNSYGGFDKSPNGDKLNFRRDFARTLLASLRDQDMITDLQFSMEPFSKLNGYDKSIVALFKSKMTIQFSADTDIDVYNLITDISQSFPGNVEIISYTLNRQHAIDDATLLAIGNGQVREGTVKGDIVLEWQGILDNLEYKKPGETPPAASPAAAASPKTSFNNNSNPDSNNG